MVNHSERNFCKFQPKGNGRFCTNMTNSLTDNTMGQENMADADGPAPRQAMSSADVLRQFIARRKHASNEAPGTPDDPKTVAAFSLERAVATALGRAAEKLYTLPVFIESVEFEPLALCELSEFLPEQALLAVVGGRQDTLGTVALSHGLVASLIEVQAIGRVSARPVKPRKPTRTDASISADFVNALLTELGRETKGQTGVPDYLSYSYVSYLDDPRPLVLMLEDGPMTRLTLRFRIGSGGQRDGVIVVALPTVPTPGHGARPGNAASLVVGSPAGNQSPVPDSASPEEPAVAAVERPAEKQTLAAAVQQAPIELVGVLCRRQMSLGAIRNLVPGAVIHLPPGALDDARLETADGQLLALGRLGDSEGFHALRLRPVGTKIQRSERAAQPLTASDLPPHLAEILPQVDNTQPDAFRKSPPTPTFGIPDSPGYRPDAGTAPEVDITPPDSVTG